MELPEVPVVDFVVKYLERYPLAEVQDIYKALYQAFHGPAHAVSDENISRHYFETEWESLDTRATITLPLIEPAFIEGITPPLYLVHLLPAKALRLDKNKIFDEFVSTSVKFPARYPPDGPELHQLFIHAWGIVGERISSAKLPFKSEEYFIFTDSMSQMSWTPVHHSDRFRKAYDPHYRLVMNPSSFVPDSFSL